MSFIREAQAAVQGGDEMWNHAALFLETVNEILGAAGQRQVQQQVLGF